MIKLYKELFYIPKHGKVCEKAMLARVVVTSVILIVCLAAMSLTAYAYFTAQDVIVPSNFIGSAKYELDIQVTDGDTPVTLTDNTFVAEAGKEYVVYLQYVSGSAETGFCGVKVGNTVYHTEQIGVDKDAENGRRDDTRFSIVAEGDGSVMVELIPHWGTSSHYDLYCENGDQNELYIMRDESILLSIVNNAVPEIYIVQIGDSLWGIAQMYETTVEKLAAYNNITDPNVILVGQEIKIPPVTWEIPALPIDPSDQPEEGPGQVTEPAATKNPTATQSQNIPETTKSEEPSDDETTEE